jgi:hypothetical protein
VTVSRGLDTTVKPPVCSGYTNEEEPAMMTPENQAAFSSHKVAYMNAYAAVSQQYALKAKQRDMLDVSPYYVGIMNAVIDLDWTTVTALLKLAGIVA